MHSRSKIIYLKCFIKHAPLITEEYTYLLTYKYFSYLFTYLHPLIPPYFPRSEIDRNKARFSPSVASFFPSFVDSERKKKKSYEMREELVCTLAAFSHYFPFFYAHPYPFCNTLLPSRGSVS